MLHCLFGVSRGEQWKANSKAGTAAVQKWRWLLLPSMPHFFHPSPALLLPFTLLGSHLHHEVLVLCEPCELIVQQHNATSRAGILLAKAGESPSSSPSHGQMLHHTSTSSQTPNPHHKPLPSHAAVLNLVEQISLAGRTGSRAVIHVSSPLEASRKPTVCSLPTYYPFPLGRQLSNRQNVLFPCRSPASLLASPVFC